MQSSDCNVALHPQKQPWDGDLYPRQCQIGELIFLLLCLPGSCKLLKNFSFSITRFSGDGNGGKRGEQLNLWGGRSATAASNVFYLPTALKEIRVHQLLHRKPSFVIQ